MPSVVMETQKQFRPVMRPKPEQWHKPASLRQQGRSNDAVERYNVFAGFSAVCGRLPPFERARWAESIVAVRTRKWPLFLGLSFAFSSQH